MPPPKIRTFSISHSQAGYIEFSIPLQSPTDVDAYLHRVLADLPVTDRMTIHSEMMKRAEELWNGYALWLGDPEKARLELRNMEEHQLWSAA